MEGEAAGKATENRLGPVNSEARCSGLCNREPLPLGGGLDQPLVTVITVVRNGVSLLERTLQSVLEQSYPLIESIVIDGHSTDGTVDIIKRYSERLAFWTSEPDAGIYDAMNKGIGHASGAWILFLNAGDVFADREVVCRLMQGATQNIDILYGGHEEDYGSGRSAIRSAATLDDLWKGMICSHQAMLVRTPLLKRHKFNAANLIAADYELLYTLANEALRFRRTSIIISRVLADGFSASRNLRLTIDQWRVARRFAGPSVRLDLYHIAKFVGVYCKNMIKKILPRGIVAFLRTKEKRID